MKSTFARLFLLDLPVQIVRIQNSICLHLRNYSVGLLLFAQTDIILNVHKRRCLLKLRCVMLICECNNLCIQNFAPFFLIGLWCPR
jgi:hypothetical protein